MTKFFSPENENANYGLAMGLLSGQGWSPTPQSGGQGWARGLAGYAQGREIDRQRNAQRAEQAQWQQLAKEMGLEGVPASAMPGLVTKILEGQLRPAQPQYVGPGGVLFQDGKEVYRNPSVNAERDKPQLTDVPLGNNRFQKAYVWPDGRRENVGEPFLKGTGAQQGGFSIDDDGNVVFNPGQKPKTPEQAAKISALQVAEDNLAEARKLLIDDTGKDFKQQVAIQARLPVPFVEASVPGEGRKVSTAMRTAIEAALRAMTGAAAPESEVDRYMDLYMPNATDTYETANQKLGNLHAFIKNAKSLSGQVQQKLPQPGEVLDGYRFKGGNPADAGSWEPVQ